MMLTVKTNITGRTFVIEVEGSETFDIVKTEIQDMEGIPPNEPTLIFERKKAYDDVLNFWKGHPHVCGSTKIPPSMYLYSPCCVRMFCRKDIGLVYMEVRYLQQYK